MEEPGFWDNPDDSQKIMKELKNLEEVVKSYESLENQYEEIQILIDMGYEENDPEVIPEIQHSLEEFEKKLEDLRISTLLSDEYDKNNAILAACLGKSRIFGKESVARMDGVCLFLPGYADNSRNIQISIHRTLIRVQRVRFIRFGAEKRIPVFFGIHSDRADSQLFKGTENANRDLTAVRHQYLFKLMYHYMHIVAYLLTCPVY